MSHIIQCGGDFTQPNILWFKCKYNAFLMKMIVPDRDTYTLVWGLIISNLSVYSVVYEMIDFAEIDRELMKNVDCLKGISDLIIEKKL